LRTLWLHHDRAGSLPVDVEILRKVVQRHGRDFGIDCDVVFPGHVTTDAIFAVA